MWGRMTQIVAGFWTAVSPVLLGGDSTGNLVWATNLGAAIAIILLAALSFHPKLPQAHLATSLPALWMIGAAFLLVEYPVPAVHQSNIITGLLLLILILVPTRANEPPRGWAEFNARYRDRA